MQNVAFWLSLFGQAPLCFTSDELGCYLVFAVLFPSFSSVLPPLGGPGETRLDWSLDFLEGWTTFMQCGSTQSDCRRVYLILLLLCVFAYLTAELPLIVLYLSLPLRKLLQCLWLLCNSECVCVCVCGCRVVANPAPTYTNYFMFFLKSSCFSWFALCSPKQGFVIKQVSQWCQIWWISLQSDFTDTLISEVRRYIFNKDLFIQVPLSCIGILQFSHIVTNNQHVHFSTSKYIWWITGSCTFALRAVTVWKLAFYLIYVLPID